MSEHKWSQKAFTEGGYYHGFQTCVNTWGCKTCGTEIELPMGVNPRQYQHDECKGEKNVQRADSASLSMRSDGMPTGNRHEKRFAAVQKL